MLINKFKKTKKIDFTKALREFIKNTSKDINFSQFEQVSLRVDNLRNELLDLNKEDKTIQKMTKIKGNLINYLSMLISLKSKFNFGEEKSSIKIQFGWKDTLKEDYIYSFNINFEYNCILYNLGVTYFILAYLLSKESQQNESVNKETVKNFQYAAFIFDKLLNEMEVVKTSSEQITEFNNSYLNFLINICLAYAQTHIFIISEKNSLNPGLQASLAFEHFEKFSKFRNTEELTFIKNRRLYYNAVGLIKCKENMQSDFEAKGIGYGKMVSFVNYACEAINESLLDITKSAKLFDYTDAKNYKIYCESLQKEMLEKNKKIYFDAVLESKFLEVLDPLVKAKLEEIPEKFNIPQQGFEIFDKLLSSEVMIIIENFNKNMSAYLNKTLEKYNPVSFNQFLFQLGLPHSVEKINKSGFINESLWEKIMEIQKIGGANLLIHNLKLIKETNEEIFKKLEYLVSIIKKEEDEDSILRQMYKGKWTRPPSSTLNTQALKILDDFKQKIIQAKSCDEIAQTQIFENMRFFELISASKEAILRQIPNSEDFSNLQSHETFTYLTSELNKFQALKEELILKINKIFQTLQNESIINDVFKIIKKQQSEQGLFEEEKKKYDLLIKEVDELHKKLIDMKTHIINANEKFDKLKAEKISPNKENEAFFNKLENSVILYNQKFAMIQQGVSFYNEMNFKLNETKNSIFNFLRMREDDKRQLLIVLNPSYISNFPNRSTGDSYLDKEINPITNLNYEYHYIQKPNEQHTDIQAQGFDNNNQRSNIKK